MDIASGCCQSGLGWAGFFFNVLVNLKMSSHQQVTISWTGKDKESSIFDYEIGLSSDPSNPTPDLVTFMSSSGHDHFVMYHPHISQGSVFHLVVKAVNKAQLSTTKVCEQS